MQIQDDKPYDEINITPMLDLAYVLLVIFILMCTASVQGLKVDLPKASSAAAAPHRPKTKVIAIANDGSLTLAVGKDVQPVTLAELEQRLGQLKSSGPDFPVVVTGDSLTQYQAVMNVLDMLGRLNLTQVGLTTKVRN